MTDSALRKALRQQEEQNGRQLPTNFAFKTMKRIERECHEQEHREKTMAGIVMVACCLLGVGVMVFFFGQQLLNIFLSLIPQGEAFGIVPGMAFCFVFFALLNAYLRRSNSR